MSRPTSEGGEEFCLPIENEEPRDSGSNHRIDKDVGLGTCRVCQCVEPDRRGSAALEFLGISPPQLELNDVNEEVKSNLKVSLKNTENNRSCIDDLKGSELVEFISPSGEVFICTADVEMGVDDFCDKLIELGCSCKNDLALAHYACALKWFINHGSTVCEICGSVAKNVKLKDMKRILVSLKKYEALMERVANGQPNPASSQTHLGVDPDAVAAIRRQRLSEISLWFNPHNSYSVTTSQVVSEQRAASNVVVQEDAPTENTATKCRRYWDPACYRPTDCDTCMVHCSSCWKENCQKWPSYSSRRHLCIDSGGFLSFFCADKNQIWACTLLGNPVCFLVSRVWDMGFENT